MNVPSTIYRTDPPVVANAGKAHAVRRLLEAWCDAAGAVHLEAYTTECTWRHNRRDVAAVTKFIQALGGLDAGPLGYRELVACG